MKIIGVTGPTGSGKSLFCDYLSEQGIPVIDADEVYHGLLVPPSPCLYALRRVFGDGILRPDGTLDRTALSDIVFHDEKKLSLLNDTVLGFVLDRIRAMLNELAARGHTHAAVDAPTLIESGFHRECDTVISILSPAELRVERIIARDHITRERAEARVHAQKGDDFYKEHSHYVLTNSGDPHEFFKKINELTKDLSL
ncbi:MAG: dephospho-CoA kinase [Clostridia bacterium]|nr:dephospho-CoA kinase [Clostridia bacterium]